MFNCKPFVLALSLLAAFAFPAFAQEHGYRLPDVDLHKPIIWGATCEGPDGIGLKFGGEDQTSDDGCGHTQILKDGKWVGIYKQIQSGNPLNSEHDRCVAMATEAKNIGAAARRFFLDDSLSPIDRMSAAAIGRLALSGNLRLRSHVDAKLTDLANQLRSDRASQQTQHDQARIAHVQKSIDHVTANVAKLSLAFSDVTPTAVDETSALQIELERIAEELDCEPAPRALSQIVYEPKSQCFVLFGGDHCDYLTNDTWIFDPANSTWTRREPPSAPPPRANHTLKATGDGKIVLSGGYTYTSTTDYMGGQYANLNDGDWTYEVEKNTWTGGKGVPANDRVYRTGPFLPGYFLRGPKPNPAEFAAKLAALPANTWLYTAPPQLPKMNRDWGSAVIDPDHDLILRFSGGHCAHGGSDVLQFHLATNRWELPFPVEFPLGQLYSNTSYPQGWNLNHRPWVTGHTYQSYGYDPASKKMLFVGKTKYSYLWDPEVADWTTRYEKPEGMVYDSSYYTLTVCNSSRGLVCWTHDGGVYRFDAVEHEWRWIDKHGEKLPGSEVDNSTVAFDSHRDRLLFVRKGYGDANTFNGEIHSLDLKTGEVTKLVPGGSAAAAKIPYLCQLRYDPQHDLLLVGATLPPDASGLRRTPAYDCAGNRWVSLKIGGDDPSGKVGRNVSLGMMYDAKRKLFWAVDTNSKVFVLRLDPATADLKPL